MRHQSIRVDDFVEGLKKLEDRWITKERVLEYCSGLRLEDRSLDRFLGFRDDRYARHLIFRDRLFEVMAICWQPGQRTPVHSHNGQLGWMMVERGGIEVDSFRYVGCNAPENQNVTGIDCLAGATAVQLDRLGNEALSAGGPVSTVDKIQTIHRIGCPPDSRERAVSIHIYSLPFESCVTFDLEASRCARRTLFWDSQYGTPSPDSEPTLR